MRRFVLLFVAVLALIAMVSALPIDRSDRSLAEVDSTSACAAVGGSCSDVRTAKCSNGAFKAGMCPGSAHVQCCVPKSTSAVAAPAAAAAPAAPVSNCARQGGTCMNSKAASCSSGFKSGLCPGAAEMKCCLNNAAPAPAAAAPAAVPAPASVPVPATPASSGKLTFTKLANCYPQGEAEDVKKRLGGAVTGDWITNTCAIRMSHTLNCAGRPIPQMGGESIRGKTPTRWNYIFRVKQLSPYIKKVFGPGVTIKASGGRGVSYESLKGKQGIIYFDTTGTWSDATGHFDLWDGQLMVETSHANKETVDRYFASSVSVTFWQF